MKDMLKNKLFWIFSVLFAVGVFLVAINSSRTYQSNMDVLFLPKSEMAVNDMNQIVANAKQIPLSLSFYNKLLENNADIEDGAVELPDAKRKDFWNSEIEVEQIGKSGAVRIAVFSSNPLQAEITSRAAANGLVVVMSNYYDIKTDLNMRIIDGPITKNIARLNVYLWTLLSLLVGFIFSFVINSLVDFVVEKIGSIRSASQIESAPIEYQPAFPSLSFPKMEIGKKEDVPLETEDIFNFNVENEQALVEARIETKPEKKEGTTVAFMAGSKKAAAPANLPIAEEEFSFDETLPVEENEEKINTPIELPKEIESVKPVVDAAPIDVTREATPEEVKERLNKLLSGGIFK